MPIPEETTNEDDADIPQKKKTMLLFGILAPL
jgi:hypothetical protein